MILALFLELIIWSWLKDNFEIFFDTLESMVVKILIKKYIYLIKIILSLVGGYKVDWTLGLEQKQFQ